MQGEKSRKLTTITVFVAVLLILVLIAVEELRDGTQKAEPYKIILIPKIIDENNDFWTSLTEGARLGAEELGAEIEVVGGTSEEDYERQNELIRQSAGKKPDALLISPCSYTYSTKAIQEVVDQGIKVILIDSVVDRDVAEGIVATDNFKAGEELGRYARRFLTPQSRIGIVAHVKGSSTAAQRSEGIEKGLGERREQIQDIVYCNSSYDLATELAEKMLKDNPEISLLIGTNEYSAVGAARAVKQLGLDGKVNVIGFDNSVEEIQLMEAGVFQGIVIQKPFNMGYLGVDQAVKSIQGFSVDYNLDSGCKLITRDNMYEQENQKLLYPFSGKQ